MRCGKVETLAERYVDGRLPAPVMAAVSAHERTCPRCAARIAEARRVALALNAAAGTLTAPAGLLDAVMDAVYREALRGTPDPQTAAPVQAAVRGRVYRKLGYCLVFSAAVFAASPLLAGQPDRAASTAVEAGGASVKNVLAGAGLTVQGILHSKGGNTR